MPVEPIGMTEVGVIASRDGFVPVAHYTGSLRMLPYEVGRDERRRYVVVPPQDREMGDGGIGNSYRETHRTG